MSLGAQCVKSNTMPAGPLWHGLWTALRSALSRLHVRKKRRVLRVQETLALGDRRFLAIVQFENRKLLVGVTPQNINLLEARDINSEEAARDLTPEEEHSA